MASPNNTVTQLTTRPVLRETNLRGVSLYSRGKVRDVYEAGTDCLCIVATDRLSAFDVVMAEGIPDKGRVLNQLSRFWFDFLHGAVPNHFLTVNVEEYPKEFQPFSHLLEGRSMLVKRSLRRCRRRSRCALWRRLPRVARRGPWCPSTPARSADAPWPSGRG